MNYVKNVDSLIIIPNEKLIAVLGKNTSLINAFNTANDVLKGAVKGISDLITCTGMVNVDFADVKTVMSEMGMAMMGTGIAKGDKRAQEAARSAIMSPLLEDIDLRGARGILVNITAGLDLSLGEYSEIGEIIEECADADATIVIGTVIDPDMVDELRVTVVATGLDRPKEKEFKLVATEAPKADLRQEEIELPSVLRRQKQEALLDKPDSHDKETGKRKDYGELDIPTFLRRQAD